jgi:hypothetical protein
MKTTIAPLTDEALASIQRMFDGALPPLGNWQHSTLSESIHAGEPKERGSGYECLANDSMTGITARIDECCEVEVEQAEDNLYILLAAANVAPALLAEVAESRALRQRVEEVLDKWAAIAFNECDPTEPQTSRDATFQECSEDLRAAMAAGETGGDV